MDDYKSRISHGVNIGMLAVVLMSLTFLTWQKLIIRPLDKRTRFVSDFPENKTTKEAESVLDDRQVFNTIKPPPGTQMGKLQIAAILKAVNKDGNLLVWGLGNDSPFWYDCTRGKVVFVEPAGVWYNKILGKYPHLETYKVEYTTDIDKSFDKYINNTKIWSELDLRSQLPTLFTETDWDVIIVDSPTGYEKGHPGRFQSIYTSSVLARNGTPIFVDDYDRRVERAFSNKMLGKPIEVVDRPRALVNKNKQAHFIMIKR